MKITYPGEGGYRKEIAPVLRPWEESHHWCEEADEVENGVRKLVFHCPIGIGGTVAGDTGCIVQ